MLDIIRKPIVYEQETGQMRVLRPNETLFGAMAQFSFKRVPENKTLVIPSGQQMLLRGDITILGELQIEEEGELWQL